MQEKYPQKPGLDFILKQAFYYWNRTLLYQLMFSIIYFALFFSSIFFFADYFGIFEFNDELQIALQKGFNEYLQKSQELGKTENAVNFVYSVLGTIIFLYPLNLGFYQIFKMLDLKEPTELSDLFVGYRGLNFFRYMSYFIFWFFFYSLIAQTVILPVIWVIITLFVAPLMFFQNKTIFEGIALNWKALKMYFIEIFVCVIVAFLFKYIGFALFLVGGLLTFPFWNAMIYSLYKTIFEEIN
ncbi:hypothetical protein [Chryseobacterium wangxinyae]|uniref:hypothetical protein n=1 Tax=Chryseobacterium sp. CY353 TaxID=2997334 RepID=UPI00226E83AF|nr:hypothetical protein [Chryseobacterium sp. CY353]MCY0969682.1 hypothetical protein [Chryseobacterium sp. CY353]